MIISPGAGGIIGIGNSAVIIGLWPAHFIWTCYCVAKYASIFPLLNLYDPFYVFEHLIKFYSVMLCPVLMLCVCARARVRVFIFPSFFFLLRVFQNQKAWTGLEDIGVGVASTASSPLANLGSCM